MGKTVIRLSSKTGHIISPAVRWFTMREKKDRTIVQNNGCWGNQQSIRPTHSHHAPPPTGAVRSVERYRQGKSEPRGSTKHALWWFGPGRYREEGSYPPGLATQASPQAYSGRVRSLVRWVHRHELLATCQNVGECLHILHELAERNGNVLYGGLAILGLIQNSCHSNCSLWASAPLSMYLSGPTVIKASKGLSLSCVRIWHAYWNWYTLSWLTQTHAR
jgi:hypothetical protein